LSITDDELKVLLEAMMELNRNFSSGSYESGFDSFFLEMMEQRLIDIYLTYEGKSNQ
jgi:hypothetical protein